MLVYHRLFFTTLFIVLLLRSVSNQNAFKTIHGMYLSVKNDERVAALELPAALKAAYDAHEHLLDLHGPVGEDGQGRSTRGRATVGLRTRLPRT